MSADAGLLFDNVPTLEVFEFSLGVSVCTYAPCSATITWAQIVKTGKLMCFTGPLSELKIVRHGSHEGKRTVVFEHRANHWKDCPGAPEFKKQKWGAQDR